LLEDSVHTETSRTVQVRGFTDVMLEAGARRSSGASSVESHAALGALDLFVIAQVAPRVRFLTETVFHQSQEGEWEADVERLMVQYTASDAAHVTMGRVHTPLGIWNEDYHHGRLFYPTVERPQALLFEDDGGILPIHSVALGFSGMVPLGSGNLAYDALLANGRGLTADEAQASRDRNRNKALAGTISFIRAGSPSIRFGGGLYRDEIPEDSSRVERQRPLRETIASAHLGSSLGRIEWIGEAYWITHEERGGTARFDHTAAYGVLTLSIGKWKPYLGFDFMAMEEGDPFYGSDVGDLTRSLVGIRHDLSPSCTLKLEYRYEDWNPDVTHVTAFQAAVGF